MPIWDPFLNKMQEWFFGNLSNTLLSQAQRERMSGIAERRAYRDGMQRQSLKVKLSQSDDNVILNNVGKAVDQSLSMLFGESIKVDLGGIDDDDDLQDWLDTAWQLNGGEILLKRLGMMGADSGICYVKLMPEGREDIDGRLYPRMVAMDPMFMEVFTEPSDYERVVRYVYEYETDDPESGKPIRFKQVFKLEDEQWIIEDYKTEPGSDKYELVTGEGVTNPQTWDYDFPPIVHWQNLPSVKGVIGTPDITDDIIRLQDKINYVASNINKIIRLNAHPRWYGTGFASGQLGKMEWGPEDFLKLPTGAEVGSAEMSSELTGSREWVQYLTKELYSLMHAVDVNGVRDKLGQLTNFAVRVLYQDALAKNHDKRDLYGAAIVELSRNMMVMADVYADSAKPINIVWPDPLPTNEQEETLAIKNDMELGLVSRQTASKKRGYDWSVEGERMADEKAAEGSVGEEILRLFETGGNL